MILSFRKKEKIIDFVQETFNSAFSVIVADLGGLKSNLINQLRKESRDFSVCVKVLPNSLLRKGVKKTSYACLSRFFVGQNILAFSLKEPRSAAHLFLKFSKNNDNFNIKGAALDGKLVKLSEINILSNLPNYQESILRLILTLKIISVGNLMNVFKKLSEKRVQS